MGQESESSLARSLRLTIDHVVAVMSWGGEAPVIPTESLLCRWMVEVGDLPSSLDNGCHTSVPT